jgi:ferredoxin
MEAIRLSELAVDGRCRVVRVSGTKAIIALISIGAIHMVVNYLVDQLKGPGACHDCGECSSKCPAGDNGGKKTQLS